VEERNTQSGNAADGGTNVTIGTGETGRGREKKREGSKK
jgi:hypothetical protein